MTKLMLSVGLINLLGVMSPGPDFAIVTQAALTGSRRCGVMAALGIAMAVLWHVSYCALGLSAAIEHMPAVFLMIKLLGGSYLIYLGLRALLSRRLASVHTQPQAPRMSLWQAWRLGFVTNALNPKAALFLLTMFTMLVAHHLNGLQLMLLALEIFLIVLIWFAALSWMMTHPRVYHHFMRHQHSLMQVLGVALILFGIALFFVSHRVPMV